MTTIATSKVEALYGAALRDQGFKICVLLHSPDSITQRIFCATGPTDFIYFCDFGIKNSDEEDRRHAKEVLREYKERKDLFSFEVDGFRIGRNALSLATRNLRVGKVDLSISAHVLEVEKNLGISFRAKNISQEIIKAIKPNLAIFLERGYSPAGELFDACLIDGVDVVQWLGAPQNGKFLFKRYDLSNRDKHPLALSEDTWCKIRTMIIKSSYRTRLLEEMRSHYQEGAWYNRQQLQTGKKIFDRSKTLNLLGVSSDRKVAVIFSHILYDATFFYGSSLFGDYESWLVETIRCAIKNENLDWIVKVHPVNVWRSRMDNKPLEQLEETILKKEFGALPSHIKLLPADSEINTFSLFDSIDVGLTVRGTIGLELPCWGVPIITAGTGRYSGNGFTIDPVNKSEYRELMSRLHEVPKLNKEETRLAHLYAAATLFGRSFPMKSFLINFDANTLGLPELSQNTFLSKILRSTGKFESDIETITEWMSRLRTSDLMSIDLSKEDLQW